MSQRAVPRLVLLNGPPGIGKSALAERYVGEHPPTLNLDIDRVRDLVGGWRQDVHGAGLMARELTLVMARTHLLAGHDVVVPQYLGRVAFIEQLEQLAADAGAGFREIVLMDDKDRALRRFLTRADETGSRAHRDAQDMVERASGTETLSAMYDRLVALVESRPHAEVVQSGPGAIDETYDAVVARLSR